MIWAKPNGLPESVRDCCARKHEAVWHFTKSERYSADMGPIREPLVAPGRTAGHNALKGQGAGPAGGPSGWRSGNSVDQPGPTGARHSSFHPLGALPPDVWSIATEPLRVPEELGVEHFAAFTAELMRRIVLGWSPQSGVVLDALGGTGTPAAVARALGRHGISVELSADYCRPPRRKRERLLGSSWCDSATPPPEQLSSTNTRPSSGTMRSRRVSTRSFWQPRLSGRRGGSAWGVHAHGSRSRAGERIRSRPACLGEESGRRESNSRSQLGKLMFCR